MNASHTAAGPVLVVHTTCASRKEAEKIGVLLVKEKLAACASVFPCKSFFFWKGRLQRQREFVLGLNKNLRGAPPD